MGIWATVILVSVVFAVSVRLLFRLGDGEARGVLREADSLAVMSPEADRRMRAGFNGLNEDLSFLGAQSFRELPMEDESTEDVESPNRLELTPEPPPVLPEGYVVPGTSLLQEHPATVD